VAYREEQPPVDVVVVGGGIVGLACAWRAASRGLRVRVLERGSPGGEASHVAAGMLAPAGEAYWGEERAAAMSLAAAGAWPGFAAELEAASGEPVGYARRGALHLALDRDEAEVLRRRASLMAALGLRAEWLTASECRRLEPGVTADCAGGLHAPDEAAVDPRVVLRVLQVAAERAGAEVVEGAEVVAGVEEDGRLAGVTTMTGGAHRAAAVVLATGAWAGGATWIPEEARPPVRPVKGQVLVLRGPAETPVCERLIVTERVYLVPRDDGRLVVGATVEEQGFDRRVTAGGIHELLREAYRALPDIAELEMAEALAGLRPGTPDNLPLVGPSGLDGLLLATGHYRNGVLLAPVTADAIAAALEGAPPQASMEAANPGRFERMREAVAT
jgi:glycine oxidase